MVWAVLGFRHISLHIRLYIGLFGTSVHISVCSHEHTAIVVHIEPLKVVKGLHRALQREYNPLIGLNKYFVWEI